MTRNCRYCQCFVCPCLQRLAPIPVFTVANPKNEFVLVAGEVRCLCKGHEWEYVGCCSALA